MGYKSGILTNPVSKASILAKSSLIGLRFFDASFDFSPIKLCFAKMHLKSEYTTHIYNCPLWITSLFGLKKGNLRPDIDSFAKTALLKTGFCFIGKCSCKKRGCSKEGITEKYSKKWLQKRRFQRKRYSGKDTTKNAGYRVIGQKFLNG